MAEFLSAAQTTAAVLIVAGLTGAAIAAVLFIAYQLSRIVAARREKRRAWARTWDASEDQVQAFTGQLTAVRVARSPLADTAAALDRAELATAAAQHRRPVGAHRAEGDRDPRLHRLRRDTEVFAAIAEAESGEPLIVVGPREKNLACRRIAWTPAHPIAEQLALDLTAAGAVR